MTKLLFQKFFAVECGILGVCSILYAVAALLGWKYARPRRWWDWEPAKSRSRKNAPAICALGVILLFVCRWPFQPEWEPPWKIWLVMIIASFILVSVGEKKFTALAKEQGIWSTRNITSRILSAIASSTLILGSFFRKIWQFHGILLQIGLIFYTAVVILDYLAPPDKSEENSRA